MLKVGDTIECTAPSAHPGVDEGNTYTVASEFTHRGKQTVSLAELPEGNGFPAEMFKRVEG